MVCRTLLVCSLLVLPLASAAQDPGVTRHISVVGSVYDSVANRPLEDALVQVVPTGQVRSARTGTTDARGRYRIDSVVPGEYFVSFFHVAADSLGIQPAVHRMTLGRRDPESVDLGLPTVQRIVAALCVGFPTDDSSAVMVGEVRDADTHAPIPGATVIADWVDFIFDDEGFHVVRQTARTTASETGAFTLCGLPPGSVAAHATSASHTSGKLEVTPEPGSVVRRDFTVGEGTTFVTVAGEPVEGEARLDTLLRGPARLTGTVLNESGRPVGDAIVEVWRTGLSTRTDAAGGFELTRLPVGTHALEVRRIGFAPYQVPVQLASMAPTSVNVVLWKPVRQLEAIRVTARTLYSRRRAEIERRRRSSAVGHFILRDELERHPTSRISDVLREVPGVRVMASGPGTIVTFTRAVTASGPCQPTLFLDGHRLGVAEDVDVYGPARSLEAIEVYPSGIHGPAEFYGACGAIVLWTHIEPRYPKLPQPKKPRKKGAS